MFFDFDKVGFEKEQPMKVEHPGYGNFNEYKRKEKEFHERLKALGKDWY